MFSVSHVVVEEFCFYSLSIGEDDVVQLPQFLIQITLPIIAVRLSVRTASRLMMATFVSLKSPLISFSFGSVLTHT